MSGATGQGARTMAAATAGAAKARCANGWTYVVANFDPLGNGMGRRPY